MGVRGQTFCNSCSSSCLLCSIEGGGGKEQEIEGERVSGERKKEERERGTKGEKGRG